MIGTRQLSALLQRVVNARGKLVLVGDHRQLPELQAGGVFRGLVHRGVAVELTQNVRQLNAWERDTLDELRDGDAERAMEQYARRGRIISGGDVRRQLVDDWRMLGRDPDQSLMIARRRADVAELNLRARQLLRQVGELGPEEIALPGGGFAVGDRVIIKRNASVLDVSNGERGRVVAIGESGVTLQCGDTARRPRQRVPARAHRSRRAVPCPRLRDHGARRPGPHNRADLRARRRGRHARMALRRDEPRPPDESALHRRRGPSPR